MQPGGEIFLYSYHLLCRILFRSFRLLLGHVFKVVLDFDILIYRPYIMLSALNRS
jgi:hypothetical protein